MPSPDRTPPSDASGSPNRASDEGPTHGRSAAEDVLKAAVTLLRDAARRGDARQNFVSRAVEMLSFHAEIEPDELARARKPEVWAAAALHSAPFTIIPGRTHPDRPTLRDAARIFGVSSQSVSVRTQPLRDSWYETLDAGAHPSLPGVDPDIAVVMVFGGVEVIAQPDPGGAAAALFDAAAGALQGAPPPGDVAFDLEQFARDHGRGGPDVLALRDLADRAADLYCRDYLRRPRDGRRWHEVLEQPVGFAYFLREALRGRGPSQEVRDALAWYAVGLLAGEASDRPVRAPEFALIALAHLAGRARLEGASLRTAVELATRDRAALEDIATEELRPLWHAVGADEAAPADVRAETLCLLVAAAGAARGRRGVELTSALARDDALTLDVRRAALGRLADADTLYGTFGRVTSGIRRYALRHLTELERLPWRAAADLAAEAEELDDPLRSRAAAEVLEEHGASAPEQTVRPLVERGMANRDAAARQAWYRAGVRLLGAEVRDWAPPDVVSGAERTSGRKDSAQTSLF